MMLKKLFIFKLNFVKIKKYKNTNSITASKGLQFFNFKIHKKMGDEKMNHKKIKKSQQRNDDYQYTKQAEDVEKVKFEIAQEIGLTDEKNNKKT